MNKQEAPHVSVMPNEFLEGFASVSLRTFFDGTLGAGGHAEALLEAHPEIEMYIGCDRDQSALEIAKKRLAPWKKKMVYVHGNYRDLDKYLKQQKIKAVDGFFDLGVSSMQLDQDYRGFSFSKEGPLDMRMDPTEELTAQIIVNTWSEEQLAEIIREYGEEPRWRRAAKAIVAARRKRPLRTTQELSNVILEELKSKTRGRLHPATLVFQALRMCVNREIDSLSEGLTNAIKRTNVGGRIGVMSFHRLEDRIVKNIFKAYSIFPSKKQKEDAAGFLKIVTKKPLVPSLAEIRRNPRSRSAKLRFAERA